MQKPLDLALAKAVAEVIKGELASREAEWNERHAFLLREIDALQEQIAKIPAGPKGEPGEKGLDGQNGRDGERGADGANGRDGIDGKDGRDGVDGQNGKDGAPGQDGKDGRDGIDGKDGEHGIAGANGKDGIDGANGKDGADGINGKDGRDGIDGKSVTLEEVAGWLEGEIAQWELQFERRAQDVLQRAIDRMPAPKDGKDGKDGIDGKDGVDGLGFDDMSFIQHNEREAEFKFTRGEHVKSFPVRLAGIAYRGIYKADVTDYAVGDNVTYDGSIWIAQKTEPGKPGVPNSGWKLAVKHGNHGKDGQPGPRGEKGEPGKDGRDLTSRGWGK